MNHCTTISTVLLLLVTLTATGKARRGEVTYTFDGFVLGDRIFGSGKAVNGEDTWDCRFTGYLRQVDSPSIGWSEGDAKRERKEREEKEAGGTP